MIDVETLVNEKNKVARVVNTLKWVKQQVGVIMLQIKWQVCILFKPRDHGENYYWPSSSFAAGLPHGGHKITYGE